VGGRVGGRRGGRTGGENEEEDETGHWDEGEDPAGSPATTSARRSTVTAVDTSLRAPGERFLRNLQVEGRIPLPFLLLVLELRAGGGVVVLRSCYGETGRVEGGNRGEVGGERGSRRDVDCRMMLSGEGGATLQERTRVVLRDGRGTHLSVVDRWESSREMRRDEEEGGRKLLRQAGWAVKEDGDQHSAVAVCV
jgi:hypothetical protein